MLSSTHECHVRVPQNPTLIHCKISPHKTKTKTKTRHYQIRSKSNLLPAFQKKNKKSRGIINVIIEKTFSFFYEPRGKCIVITRTLSSTTPLQCLATLKILQRFRLCLGLNPLPNSKINFILLSLLYTHFPPIFCVSFFYLSTP